MPDRKEYIERGAIEKSLEATPIRIAADKGKIFRVIKNIPAADVVEVVRCSQCRYYDERTTNSNGFEICPASGMEIHENDYCSYGERKDG